MEHEAWNTKHIKRPLVFLNDVHKAIEWCLFFYERGVLPLIGEPQNPAVTLSVAKQYGADAILVDQKIFGKFRKEILESGFDPKFVVVI